MQSNKIGDFKSFKSHYGLTKGVVPNVSTSLKTGIRILATKGFKGGITYNSKTGYKTYTFKGWNSGIKSYNGNGTAGYQANVLRMISNSKEPTSKNY